MINFCSLIESSLLVAFILLNICWCCCELTFIMADALVERRPPARFFCHRCLVEFQDVEQNYVCPYCESGFIEQLEADSAGFMPNANYSDADMSSIDDMNVDDMGLDDSDELSTSAPPVLNDIAFLMSGARMRATVPTAANRQPNLTVNVEAVGAAPAPPTRNSSTPTPGREHTLIEELLWMISGGRPPAGAVTAGTPFVLVGTPGDYVFGGEGLDAVVTQLLGQLEHSGPPPLPRETLAALPTEKVSAEMAATNTACSVCWENFQLDETISRLECEHVFHQTCITPWLELHATCPICRRSLMPPPPEPAPAPAPTTSPSATTITTTTTTTTTPSFDTITPPRYPTPQIRFRRGRSSGLFVNATPRIVIQRRTGAMPTFIRRLPSQTQTWDSLNDTSSSGSAGSSVTAAGVWANPSRTSNSTGPTNSSSSLNSNDRERQYNTDIDYD